MLVVGGLITVALIEKDKGVKPVKIQPMSSCHAVTGKVSKFASAFSSDKWGDWVKKISCGMEKKVSKLEIHPRLILDEAQKFYTATSPGVGGDEGSSFSSESDDESHTDFVASGSDHSDPLSVEV